MLCNTAVCALFLLNPGCDEVHGYIPLNFPGIHGRSAQPVLVLRAVHPFTGRVHRSWSQDEAEDGFGTWVSSFSVSISLSHLFLHPSNSLPLSACLLLHVPLSISVCLSSLSLSVLVMSLLVSFLFCLYLSLLVSDILFLTGILRLSLRFIYGSSFLSFT